MPDRDEDDRRARGGGVRRSFAARSAERDLVREVRAWLASLRAGSAFTLERIPFGASGDWRLLDGRLARADGRYFAVEGLTGTSRSPRDDRFDQPILVSPDVGLVGFLAQRRGGRWFLLFHAKTEPGNEGTVQLAPTIQAAESSNGRGGRGREPAFQDLFLHQHGVRVLVDRLQSEPGSRFLRKQNRNLVLALPPDRQLVHDDAWRWFSLSEASLLLRHDHLVNTDSRSVISCLPRAMLAEDLDVRRRREAAQGFERDLLESLDAPEEAACHRREEILSWMTDLRARYGLEVRQAALNALPGWSVEPDAIRHVSGRFFAIQHFRVHAAEREVPTWDQPLVVPSGDQLVAFVAQRRRTPGSAAGVLHLLVQARVEPGHRDVLELTSTVQCVPTDHEPADLLARHPYAAYVLHAPESRVRASSLQTVLGGRFYRNRARHVVVEAPEEEDLGTPEDFRWLTLGQVKDLLRVPGTFSTEARSLIANLSP